MLTKNIKKIRLTKEIKKDWLKSLQEQLQDEKSIEQKSAQTLIEQKEYHRRLLNVKSTSNNPEAVFAQIKQQNIQMFNQYNYYYQSEVEEKLQNIIQKIKCIKQKKLQSKEIKAETIQQKKKCIKTDENNTSTTEKH